MEIKKCSSKNHGEINAISFCPKCNIYMCNKCEKIHEDLLQDHTSFNLNINEKDIFTDICKEKNHNSYLRFFCKTHNQLCCGECITKIKDQDFGQHRDCQICLIKEIKEEKKKNLKNNIISLEKLSGLLEESINNLKIIFEKIKEKKEELKLKIQKIFTKIRSGLNEREDQLLLEVDKKYDKIFFEEEFIQQNEKLPNKIRISLEKCKLDDNDNGWNDKNKLNYLIHNCINIENNIKDINVINEKIEKYNNMINFESKIDLSISKEEIENFLKSIKSFGEIESFNCFEDSLIISNNNEYRQNLKKWINQNKKITTSLLYRKSENDDTYQTFHKLCDNKGITLTLIKSKEGFIVGGYTPLNWGEDYGWIKDTDTFLFSLSQGKVFRKLKNSESIYSCKDIGPLFNYIGFAEHGKRNMSQGEFKKRNDIYDNNYNEIIPNEGNRFFDIEEVEIYKIEFN